MNNRTKLIAKPNVADIKTWGEALITAKMESVTFDGINFDDFTDEHFAELQKALTNAHIKEVVFNTCKLSKEEVSNAILLISVLRHANIISLHFIEYDLLNKHHEIIVPFIVSNIISLAIGSRSRVGIRKECIFTEHLFSQLIHSNVKHLDLSRFHPLDLIEFNYFANLSLESISFSRVSLHEYDIEKIVNTFNPNTVKKLDFSNVCLGHFDVKNSIEEKSKWYSFLGALKKLNLEFINLENTYTSSETDANNGVKNISSISSQSDPDILSEIFDYLLSLKAKKIKIDMALSCFAQAENHPKLKAQLQQMLTDGRFEVAKLILKFRKNIDCFKQHLLAYKNNKNLLLDFKFTILKLDDQDISALNDVEWAAFLTLIKASNIHTMEFMGEKGINELPPDRLYELALALAQAKVQELKLWTRRNKNDFFTDFIKTSRVTSVKTTVQFLGYLNLKNETKNCLENINKNRMLHSLKSGIIHLFLLKPENYALNIPEQNCPPDLSNEIEHAKIGWKCFI